MSQENTKGSIFNKGSNTGITLFANLSYYDNQPMIGHNDTHRCLVEDVALLCPDECVAIVIPYNGKSVVTEWKDEIESQHKKII